MSKPEQNAWWYRHRDDKIIMFAVSEQECGVNAYAQAYWQFYNDYKKYHVKSSKDHGSPYGTVADAERLNHDLECGPKDPESMHYIGVFVHARTDSIMPFWEGDPPPWQQLH